jgi:solute:Na+ symporter, SSS family
MFGIVVVVLLVGIVPTNLKDIYILFGFSTINILLYFVYPACLISLSMYVSHAKEVNVESYFFANRNTYWFVLGISFLTPFLCSPYIFGIASSGKITGLPLAYGLISVIMLVVLGWYIAPLFIKLKINTLPDYFEKRFNRSCKFFLSALYIFSNILIRMMSLLILGNIFMTTISGLNAYSSLLFFLVITGLYVIIGGLKAELYASIIQVVFITLSVLVFTGWVVHQGGGTHFVLDNIISFNTNSQISLTELVFGLPIIAFWFWCADQFIVQKVISVRDVTFVKKAVVLSGFMQIIPILIFIVPSIIAINLSHTISEEQSLQSLISGGSLPDSLRGGMIIGGASVFMISFATLFNSTSALYTFDFYRSFNPNASDRTLVLVGRMTTMILLFISILFIPICQTMTFDTCLQLLKIFLYFSAMISTVFAAGLLIKKINSANVLLTLSIGTGVIITRAFFEIFYYDFPFDIIMFQWFSRSSYLGFSIFVFVLSISMLFVFFATGHIYNNFILKSHRSVVFKK